MKIVEVLIGISGSGKSVYTKSVQDDADTFVLSSDDIREELFGDLNHQSEDDHKKVFEELYRRVGHIIETEERYHIVIDATNLNLKRRVHHYKNTFKDSFVINRVFFVTPALAYNNIMRRNRGDMIDPTEIIDKQIKNLQMPIEGVDCDSIVLRGQKFFRNDKKLVNIYAMMTDDKAKVFFPLFSDYHDTLYHLENISSHIEYTRDLARKLKNKNLEEIALYHDTGKFYCKEFHGEYAKYTNHENLSGQLYANARYTEGLSLNPSVQKGIQLHMMAHDGLSNKVIRRYNLTEEEKSDIMKFAEIDRICSINYKHIIEKDG